MVSYNQEQTASKDKKPSGKNFEASEKRQKANLLLDSVVYGIRDVENIEIRITLAEEVVKLLATQKPEMCSQMLDAIFDNLLRAKKVETSETSQQLNSNMQKVMSIAATFDHKLAQSYIDRFSAESDSQNDNTQPRKLSEPALELQLALARQLIERDPGIAVSVANGTLKTTVTTDTIIFLGELRKKDSALAARFFTDALNSIRLRGSRDVNELLLLYPYAFSSTRIPHIVSQRLVLLQLQEYTALAKDFSVDPALARYYLQTLTDILTDASRYSAASLASLTAGVTGDIYLIKLMQPYASTYMPSLVDRLSQQQQVTANYLNPDQVAQLETNAGKFNTIQDSGPGRLENTDESLERLSTLAAETTNSVQRDQRFYRAAIIAVKEKKYETALELASKISLDYRNQAREFISFSIAERAATDGDFEKSEQMARRDSDIVRRAYILGLIAKSLVEGKREDKVRANEILIEVEQLAGKAENSNEELSILLSVAGTYVLFDNIRAFEVLREIVKEANRQEGWTGNTRVGRMINIGGFGFAYGLYNNNVSLSQLVSRLAAKNFEETLMTVQDLKNDVPRLRSLIAVCGTVLSEKSSR